MVVRKQKKSRKKQGSRTHGWGMGKKHRGAGSRGGRGHAGVGKRGASKKTKYFALGIQPTGKIGMRQRIRGVAIKPNPINLKDIELNLDKWLANKQATKEGDTFVVDLKKLGYTAVLGEGKITKKIKAVCYKFSESAKEKIEKAGGQAVVA